MCSASSAHRRRPTRWAQRIDGFVRVARDDRLGPDESQLPLDLVAQTVYDFAWYELCDWYLELTKAVLTDPNANPALRRGAQHTLVEVLGSLLKLLHPLMPFVTEELWLEIVARRGYESATLMLERYPQAEFARTGRRGRDCVAQGIRQRHPSDRGERICAFRNAERP